MELISILILYFRIYFIYVLGNNVIILIDKEEFKIVIGSSFNFSSL